MLRDDPVVSDECEVCAVVCDGLCLEGVGEARGLEMGLGLGDTRGLPFILLLGNGLMAVATTALCLVGEVCWMNKGEERTSETLTFLYI